MEWLHGLLKSSPELALFFSLALGYYVGKKKFGTFQLGGVAGSLLVAVVVSQVGVKVDHSVGTVLFSLFIYAVGYESGPQFFNSLGRQSIREILLATVLAVTALITVVVLSKLFGLDKGLAAGVAAGGLTQSAIIGTASDAIAKLGIGAQEIARLQGNVAVGYAMTYVFGSFGAIIVCVNILPKLMKKSIKDDAVKAETAIQQGIAVFDPSQQAATPELVGRIYQVTQGQSQTIADIENINPDIAITIERVKRDGQVIEANSELVLETDDIVLVVGRRNAVVNIAVQLGKELYAVEGMELTMQRRDMVLTNKAYHNKTIEEIRKQTAASVRHGIFVVQLSRSGKGLPILPETVVQMGDVVTIYGAEQDVKRIVNVVGYMLLPSPKTDFVYLGTGLIVGLLAGLLTVKIGSLPVTLGSGGGVLLSGLLFGWFRAKRPSLGAMPEAAVCMLKDFGLAGFIVVVGLSSGLEAVQTVKQHGLILFGVGMVVTILPLILTMLIGRYVLGYDNAAIFAGALSGSRSANPAFGEVLDKAENSVPTVPFAITYALANVFLTLLGPLIVAFV